MVLLNSDMLASGLPVICSAARLPVVIRALLSDLSGEGH